METVGTFLEESLKSSEGPDDWLRFFSLVGSGFALLEGTAAVPATPADQGELLREIRGLAAGLGVMAKLKAFGRTVQMRESVFEANKKYFVLMLSKTEGLKISAFNEVQFRDAIDFYKRVEERIADKPAVDAVLCSAESLRSLRKAYPNYFLDTEVFLTELDRLIC